MMPKQNSVLSAFLILTLTSFLLTVPVRAADEHVVKTSDLRQAVLDSSQVRAGNLARVRDFFSCEPAASALKKAQMDPVKIGQAVTLLDDQELAQLASRVVKVQKDLSAGALNNQQITYIIIALATAVIVILIVER